MVKNHTLDNFLEDILHPISVSPTKNDESRNTTDLNKEPIITNVSIKDHQEIIRKNRGLNKYFKEYQANKELKGYNPIMSTKSFKNKDYYKQNKDKILKNKPRNNKTKSEITKLLKKEIILFVNNLSNANYILGIYQINMKTKVYSSQAKIILNKKTNGK